MKRWWRFLIVVWLSIILSLRFSPNSQAQKVMPSNIVQQAHEAYQKEEFTRSIKLLERANQIYQDQNQDLQQARVLALISLAQQQIGSWKLAGENITASLAAIAQVPASKQKTQVLAQIYNTKGHYAFLRGNNTQALADWQQAEQLYEGADDRLGVAESRLDRAQVLSKMGYYHRACNFALKTLDFAEDSCQELTSDRLTAIIEQAKAEAALRPWSIKALNRISNSLLLMGKLDLAIATTQASQAINSNLVNPSLLNTVKTWLSLGNINRALASQAKAMAEPEQFSDRAARAVTYYQQVINSSISGDAGKQYKISAQLNLLSLEIATEQWSSAKQLVKQIDWHNTSNLYGSIKFAENLQRLKHNQLKIDYSWQDIAQIYLDTIQEAKVRGDLRVQSYSMGNLGILQSQQPNLKLNTTPQMLLENALSISQQIQASEIAYRWQWKLGQIYRQQNRRQMAIASYQASLATLASLRSDLATLTREIQFDFREQIEPIYRELADLLLHHPESDRDLETARDVIEALQVAELDNYFQDACLMFEPKSIGAIDQRANTIYTIVLPDRLEVIMARGSANADAQDRILRHHTEFIPQTDLESTVEKLRQYITEPDRTLETQQLSAQVYNWLIKPFAADLEIQQPETLVFVLDSILQPIPMSVLYDGKQYLLEKYALALTPGLRLLNPQIPAAKTAYLAGGISQPLQIGERQFSALDNVETELKTFPQDSVILNQEFTPANLLQQIDTQSASRIHIATHGQFSSNPNRTFLLMWQKLLTIKEFSQVLLQRDQIVTVPIDLLVLSACDTAVGDRRAALGLAGIAVRSGALSTLATLWQVNDESTAALVKSFYRNLDRYPNKAKALQQAQLELWKTQGKDWQVPAFWSSYILIGNW